MNKKFLILLLFSCAAQLQAKTHVSQSFLATDNVFIPHVNRYQNFWHNTDVPGKQKAIEVSVFGGASHNTKGLNKYFGPFDKDSFIVKENQGGTVDTFGNQDILAGNFNFETVDTDFHSIITFTPKWSVIGAEFNLFFQRCTKYWASLSIPLHRIKTNMNLDEDIKDTGGGAVADSANNFSGAETTAVGTMIDAFKASAMKYGKIDGQRSKTGIAEIRVTVGKNWKRTTDFYIQPYVGCSLPTGNKTKAVYLFEPIVGNGGHFSLFSGADFGIKLRESDQSIIFLSGKCTTEYRFANTQMRSIDPGGKPWGKYLAMYATDTDRGNQLYSFGTNVTTKKVEVSPHFTHSHEWQLHIIRNNFDINLGYKGAIESGESIKLKESWGNPEVADLAGTNYSPARQINNMNTGFANANASAIREHNLNLDSAGAPYRVSSTFFASLSKAWEKKDRVFTGNAGASYTGCSSNAVLRHWMIWSSLGLDF